MCRAVEELINDEKIGIIEEMLKGGKLTLEEIATYSHVSVEFVEKVKATMNGAA